MSEETGFARHVVATAGHVDHGKSALIRALTGIEPDRLEEERRRGLSIDLGYAWTTLPSGREVGFVDVPGHERFVKTMLAGVGPVGLVLFVVAADEGWKPQSEEHLQIVDVLGARAGVIAVTKADTVDFEIDAGEIARPFRGTVLESAPVVPVSSLDGRGVSDVAGALDAMLSAAPDPETTGRARLFVDRSFTMRGSGTVVTGTLTGGALRVDQTVVLLPSGVRARIRALQTHGREVAVAEPVSRVAVNLSGVSAEEAGRGDALVRPDEWRPSSGFEGTLRTVRGLAADLTARGAFKVHAGTAERDARIRLLDRSALGPGEEAMIRVTLSEPLALDPGEPFVLREAGRRATVGGGVVLDPHPPRRPGRDATDRLAARRVPRERFPPVVVAERAAVRAADLRVLTGLDPQTVDGAERAGDWWIHRGAMERAATALSDRLRAHHEAEPLSAGLGVDAARAAVGAAGLHREARDAVLDRLAAAGAIERVGTTVRSAGHRVTLGEREPDAERIEVSLRAGWPTPPTARDAGMDPALLEAMAQTGRAVRISAELYILPEQAAAAEALARELAAVGDGMTASAFRERLGTTRRFAIPLLEWLDARGVTRRSGELRRLREPS